MVKVTSLLAKGSVLESELGQKWRHGVLKASPSHAAQIREVFLSL